MADKPTSLTPAPQGYAGWLAELKGRIHNAQQRAALAVNREPVALYWQIGRDILTAQADQGWGAKVIDRLAHDLRAAFPEMKGFSPRNLKYMRALFVGRQVLLNAGGEEQTVGPDAAAFRHVLLSHGTVERDAALFTASSASASTDTP